MVDPVSLLLLGGVAMVAVGASSVRRFPHAPLAEMIEKSPFGPRKEFVQNGRTFPASFHPGIDLRAAVGTSAFAVDDGVVESLEDGAAGLILRLRLDTGERVSYVHLSSFKRAVGDRVKGGDLVALTGNTGGVAPHLHLEVKPKGATSSVDPAPFLGL